MPPTKRKTVGRITSAARRLRAFRSVDTSEERAARNESDRVRTAAARAFETIAHQNTRRANARPRSNQSDFDTLNLAAFH